jgi:hypothetical protein
MSTNRETTGADTGVRLPGGPTGTRTLPSGARSQKITLLAGTSGLSDRGLTIFEDAPGRRIKNDLPAGVSATPLRDDINRGVTQTDAFQ